MRSYLTVLSVLLVLAAISFTGCGRSLGSGAPTAEPTSILTTDPSSPRVGDEPTAPACRSPKEEEGTITPEGTPQRSEGQGPSEAEQVVELAKEDLAQRLSIAVEEIEVLSVEPVDWRDTSLGCPQTGMMYAQVITPGYRVVLAAEGQTHEYHTDLGRSVVACGQAKRSDCPMMLVLSHSKRHRAPCQPADRQDAAHAVIGARSFLGRALVCRLVW